MRALLPLCLRSVVVASVVAPLAAQDLRFENRATDGTIALPAPREAVSAFDFDRDGWPDLITLTGAGDFALFQNVPDALRPGERTFVDVTAGSGLEDVGAPRANDVQSVLAADYDRDGDLDLYATSVHASLNRVGILFRNDGGGRFTNVSEEAGIEVAHQKGVAASAAWFDHDLDGWPDLIVSTNFRPRIKLLRNEGDGSFSEHSERVVGVPDGLDSSFATTTTDVDGDGWPDAVCTYLPDRAVILRNQLAQDGGRRLVLWQDLALQGVAPMGVASGDLDDDGDVDLAISVDQEAVGVVYLNEGTRFTAAVPFTIDCTWGINWLDGDLDGDLDLFSAGACHVGEAAPDFLIENLGGGAWQDVSSQLGGNPANWSLGSVIVDFDRDLRPDLVSVDPGSQISIYQNTSATPYRGFAVQAIGEGNVNLDALGARIRISAGGREQFREVSSGTSTSCTEDLRAHFGLGAATAVDWIEVTWPRRGELASRTDRFDGPFAAESQVRVTPEVGGLVTGVDVLRASARNLSSGDEVALAVDPSDGTWNAEDSGLVVEEGDRVLMGVRGVATSTTRVGASFTGVTVQTVIAWNLATGAFRSADPLPGQTSWSFADLGLAVQPGDLVVLAGVARDRIGR